MTEEMKAKCKCCGATDCPMLAGVSATCADGSICPCYYRFYEINADPHAQLVSAVREYFAAQAALAAATFEPTRPNVARRFANAWIDLKRLVR